MTGVTILDGGMGGVLAQRMPEAAKGLWSAKALLVAPESVRQVHHDYIEAGSSIITTNTYSTIPSYLSKEGLQDRFTELTSLAGQLAREAADSALQKVQVAGSVPPLAESYRPDLVPDASKAAPVYQDLVEALRDHVDLYLCETMSSAAEACHAAEAVRKYGGQLPLYVSWTLDEAPGKGLRSGETIQQAYEQIRHFNPDAYLFNCTSPDAALAGIHILRELTDKPIGCYPNRIAEVPAGWTLDNDIRVKPIEDLSTEHYVEICLQCVSAGARLIGGCCGIGPADIQALVQRLAARQAS